MPHHNNSIMEELPKITHCLGCPDPLTCLCHLDFLLSSLPINSIHNKDEKCTFTSNQLFVLKYIYQRIPHPELHLRKIVGNKMGLPEIKIKNWFTRQRLKRRKHSNHQYKFWLKFRGQNLLNHLVSSKFCSPTLNYPNSPSYITDLESSTLLSLMDPLNNKPTDTEINPSKHDLQPDTRVELSCVGSLPYLSSVHNLKTKMSSSNVVAVTSEDSEVLQCGLETLRESPNLPDLLKVKSRHRISFTSEQLQVMKAEFKNTPYPDEKLVKEMVQRLSLPLSKIKVWFKNQRIKMKKQKRIDRIFGHSRLQQGLKTSASNFIDNLYPLVEPAAHLRYPSKMSNEGSSLEFCSSLSANSPEDKVKTDNEGTYSSVLLESFWDCKPTADNPTMVPRLGASNVDEDVTKTQTGETSVEELPQTVHYLKCLDILQCSCPLRTNVMEHLSSCNLHNSAEEGKADERASATKMEIPEHFLKCELKIEEENIDEISNKCSSLQDKIKQEFFEEPSQLDIGNQLQPVSLEIMEFMKQEIEVSDGLAPPPYSVKFLPELAVDVPRPSRYAQPPPHSIVSVSKAPSHIKDIPENRLVFKGRLRKRGIPINKPRQYTCTVQKGICFARFKTLHHLNDHQQTHNERNRRQNPTYKCYFYCAEKDEMCSVNVSKKKTLDKHMKEHHQPFMYDIHRPSSICTVSGHDSE